MKKIIKTIRALARIARNPWLLNKVLEDNAQWEDYVAKTYGLNAGLPVVQPGSLLGDFNESVYPYASLDGSSLPTDLALLKKLARGFDHCKYFEIGTWRGESVANIATVAEECFTLNLSDDQMRERGMSQKYIDLHRHFSAHLSNVTHLAADSREFDYASLKRKFDLVFIDGDHHYDLVKNDTAKVFKHLLHEDSVVVWHDYAYHPEKIRFEVLAGILDGCPQEYHSRIYHVANTMCAVYTNKEQISSPFTSPQLPGGAFEMHMSWKTGLK